jgi:pyruvate/2-oxoglutarate dehydrogenase complex dihydrolipoamide dehydrogenase (E3) component
VVDAATDRILGASILGAEGGELVQILGTLMLADLPVEYHDIVEKMLVEASITTSWRSLAKVEVPNGRVG